MDIEKESAFTRSVRGVSKDAVQLGHDKEVASKKKASKRKKKKSHRDSAATIIRLSPRADTVAMTMADGDRRRIETVDENTFIVHNNRSWKPTRKSRA